MTVPKSGRFGKGLVVGEPESSSGALGVDVRAGSDEAIVSFETFARDAEPRLRRALAAAYGPELAVELNRDALAYAWEHWAAVQAMANPVGYLYRVAQSAARRYVRWQRRPPLPREDTIDGFDPEPGLDAALARLSRDQRVAVVLVHGYGMSYREAADTLDVPVTTVRNHLNRGMNRLRTILEVDA